MLLLLLLLTLLLLLPLAMLLWRPRSQDARQSWLVRLQHRVAWGALCWAAAWQQKRLAQSTLHSGQSQQQALRRCLRRAQGPHCPLRGSTGVFPRVWGSGPKRRKPHRRVRFQNPKTTLSPSTASTERGLTQRNYRGRIVQDEFCHPGP